MNINNVVRKLINHAMRFFQGQNKILILKIVNYLKTNYLKITYTVLYLFISIILISVIIKIYCEVFYDLGNMAKDRIINSPILAFLITPLLFWIASFVYKKLAYNIYGTGLDNITLALTKLQKSPNNYRNVTNFIGLKIVFVTIVSSLISTYSGGSLGREAPSIFIATGIILSGAFYLRKYLIDLSLESWIYAGYALGISIAFNAPIAGLFYLTEKLIKNNAQNFYKSLTLGIVAIILVYFITYESCPIYFIAGFNNLLLKQIWHYFLLALICAIMAILLIRLTKYFYTKFIVVNGFKWHLIPLFFGILVAAIGYFCGIFSIGGGIRSVNESLLSPQIIYGYKEMFGRYFSTIFTHIAGNAGGLVAPSIALGNVAGGIYASLFDIVNTKTLMIVGMVAFLTPVLNVPITPAVVIIESTRISGDNFVLLAIISLMAFCVEIILKKIGVFNLVKINKAQSN